MNQKTELCYQPEQLGRARWAARGLFAALGVFAGAWGAHIPSVKTTYGLNDGWVATVLLAGGVGALLSLLVAPRILARLGVRRSCMLGGGGLGALLSMALLWPHFWLLLLGMLLIGALSSLFDVAINAEGTALESLGGRAVMSQLHGLFSSGGMAGAALSAVLLRLGVAPALQLAGVGALVVAIVLVAVRGMLPASAHHQPHTADALTASTGEPAAPAPHRTWLPRGTLLLIGLLALTGMTAEGVMYDWSVLYLRDALHQPQDRAALAYAVFSAAMAATRLGGDVLRERFAPAVLLRGGAWLSGSAMLVALLVGHPVVALLGFALVGMGLALVVPILFNAATQVPGTQRAAAIAAVSSIGYAGFLLGPPVIGGVAHFVSLPAAMGLVVLGCAALAWGAKRV